MRFSEVIGQQEAKVGLLNMVKSGKMPHALMLLGPEGNGNLSLALALAQFLQCENRHEDDSCGECNSCLKQSKFLHPDLYFTYPVIKPEKQTSPPVSTDFISEWRSALLQTSYLTYNDWMQHIGAENKQGNITAKECRQIIHQLSLKTFESSYKVQLIWLPEFLGAEGNMLLKILEEPPPKTVFVLIAESTESVLTTILSRVQIVKVPPIQESDLAAHLLRNFEMDEPVAARISRIADGNMNAALVIAEGQQSANDKVLRQWLLQCFALKQKPNSDGFRELTLWVDDFAKAGRENQKIFFRYALFFIQECLRISALGKSDKLEGEELSFAQKFTSRLAIEDLEKIQKIISQMHYYVERNANPKILLMSSSFQIAGVLKQENVEV